jgi:predicted acyl esterase
MERMTWIKPSFLWMMYRAGWGLKDSGQKRILAIDISRDGFEWALKHGCLSHADESMSKEEWETKKKASSVRIQWDPERDLFLRPLEHRAIQIGLSKEAVNLYVNQWIKNITDITPLAHAIYTFVKNEEFAQAQALLPLERPYTYTTP